MNWRKASRSNCTHPRISRTKRIMASNVPAVVEKHLDAVVIFKDGRCVLASSNLTGRYWNGSVFWFANVNDAPNIEKCVAGIESTSGISDICSVNHDKIVAGMDSGSLELYEMEESSTPHFNTLYHSTEHDHIVSSISVNSDVSRLVSSGYDKCIKVWDLESFTSIATYRPVHSDIVWQVSCSTTNPDLLISCSQDGKILLLDLRLPKPAVIISSKTFQDVPTAVSWKPQSDTAFAAGYDSGLLALHDIRNLSFTSSDVCHDRSVHRLSFSKNNTNWLASCADDSYVIVTDIGKASPTAEYRSDVHNDFVRGLSWSADNHLISCGWDKQVIKHVISPVEMIVNGPECDNNNVSA